MAECKWVLTGRKTDLGTEEAICTVCGELTLFSPRKAASMPRLLSAYIERNGNVIRPWIPCIFCQQAVVWLCLEHGEHADECPCPPIPEST